MKLVTYATPEGPRVAAMYDDGIVDLNRTDPAIPACPKMLLAQGPQGLRLAEAATA